MASRLTTSHICIAIAAVAAFTFSACGDSGDSGDSPNASKPDVTETAPVLPRVDGKWKWTLAKGSDKGTWKVKSDCASGACNFQAVSTTGSKLKYVLDRSTGVYAARNVVKVDCLDANGNIVVKNAYKTLRRNVATPTKAVAGPDGPVVTALKVDTSLKITITKAAKDSDCVRTVKGEKDRIKLKRSDAPAGDPAPVK